VEPVLAIAAELEERDDRIAQRLAAVERRRHEVEELREAVAAAERELAALPQLRAAQERDEELALAALARAVAAVREAADDAARLTAERALREAERWVTDTEEARLHAVAAERNAHSDAALATGLARQLGGDGASLQAAADWASRERGALLVEHSTLARERDAVVREASELLGSVLGEPFAATSVAGLRERLQSAL
jgi:hypothetical protein